MHNNGIIILVAFTKELLCLVTFDGKIIRIDQSATVDEFLEALLKGSAYEAAVKLVSLFSLYGGERHVPLSLLKCHAQRGIEIILKNLMDHNIYKHDGKVLKVQEVLGKEANITRSLLTIPRQSVHVASCDLKDQDRLNEAVTVPSRFILDFLCYLPSEFRCFAADVLSTGLQSFTKYAPLAILRECNQTHQRYRLHDIGLSLNVCEWIADYRSFSSDTANDVFVSAVTSNAELSSPKYSLGSKFEHDVSDGLSISDDKTVSAVKPDEHNDVFGEVH
ncbi:hypothetical protein IFM89_025146 [Coptis chinensis]|uniref:Uncharacterized protein n=1 Tax=Coptis chinensis TaxID=261450 RepID=A0A835HXZ1_9MAGN|nr:hypothetical protein IFM89_025146 [Coptis chinensis]